MNTLITGLPCTRFLIDSKSLCHNFVGVNDAVLRVDNRNRIGNGVESPFPLFPSLLVVGGYHRVTSERRAASSYGATHSSYHTDGNGVYPLI